MEMKKIAVTFLFVLTLAFLVSCTNAATGGTGNGNSTGNESVVDEEDYLAPLLGTWSGVIMSGGKNVNFTVTFTRSDYTEKYERKISKFELCGANESYFYIKPLPAGEKVNKKYELIINRGEKILYVNGCGPLNKKN